MNDVAKEYGAALFLLACEENQKKEYEAALNTVKTSFLEHPDFLELLNSPALSMAERLSVIDTVFAENLPQRVLSFLKLLCEKGRISCFFRAAEEYEALLATSEMVYNARVTSATELTDAEKKKLIQKLEQMQGGKVEAEYFTDKALLGGLTVEMDGKILDGSLRHRLGEIKEVMNP